LKILPAEPQSARLREGKQVKRLLCLVSAWLFVCNAFAGSVTIWAQSANVTDAWQLPGGLSHGKNPDGSTYFAPVMQGVSDPSALQPWTTFSVPYPQQQYQQSVAPGWTGATGRQGAGDTISVNLHSASIQELINRRGGLGTYISGVADLGAVPFATPNRTVRFTYQLKVPYFYMQGNGQGETVAYLIFYDRTQDQPAGRPFYLGVAAYRAGNLPQGANESLGDDNHPGGANLPYVQTTSGRASAFALSDFNTAEFQTSTFQDFRTFTFDLNATHFINAVLALKRDGRGGTAWSENPADYVLGNAYLNPEIAVRDGAFLHLTNVHRALRVSTEDPTLMHGGSSMNQTHRYWSSTYMNHMHSLGARDTQPTYVRESGGGFQTFAEAGAGRRLLYRCSANGYQPFLSTDRGCEGTNPSALLGTLGYIYSSPQSIAPTALYRCRRGAGYLAVTNQAECTNNGFAVEGILGYIP